MIDQLRANQLALMHYQPQLAIESPESPKQPITLNFDKRFDTEFQSAYGLPRTNEFPSMAKDE